MLRYLLIARTAGHSSGEYRADHSRRTLPFPLERFEAASSDAESKPATIARRVGRTKLELEHAVPADDRDQLRQLAGQIMSPAAQRLLDPSDVVQQAMLRAHQARQRFRGESADSRQAWLRRILRRTLADMLRDRLRRRRDARRERSIHAADSSASPVPVPDSDRHDPAEIAVRREADGLLLSRIDELPPDHAFAIREKFLRERTLEEIAADLGRSAPAIAGLIRRGLAILRSRHDKSTRDR